MENEEVLSANKITGTKTWDEIESYAKEQKQRQEEHIERFPELMKHPPYEDEKKRNFFQHMMESRLNRYNEEDLHGKEMRKEMHLCKFCHYLTSFMGGAALTMGKCSHCGETEYYPSTHIPMLCNACSEQHEACKECGNLID